MRYTLEKKATRQKTSLGDDLNDLDNKERKQ